MAFHVDNSKVVDTEEVGVKWIDLCILLGQQQGARIQSLGKFFSPGHDFSQHMHADIYHSDMFVF